MRTLILFGSAALALVACTQDYGQFGFGGGGTGASTSSSSTTSTTGTTTTTTSSGGGEGGAGGATTTTTTSSGGGAGGAPPTVSVDCDGNACDVDGTQRCCWDNGNDQGTCEADGNCGGDIPIECDEQSDCPGQVCCVDRSGNTVNGVTCVNNCTGQSRPICEEGNAASCMGTTCQPQDGLPDGYFTCQ